MRRMCVAIVLAVVVGCGGSDAGSGGGTDPGPTCSIGSLTGTWRLHYVQMDGTCGPIPDETGHVDGTLSPTCTLTYRQVSADHCGLEMSFTCPTLDGQGTYTWVLAVHQASDTKLLGSGTVQVVDPAITCRGTYDLTVTKL